MRYRGCVDTRWNISSGLSLGLFIFTPGEEDEDSQKIRVHEYGHCIQPIVLGPLYMLLGIISIVWRGTRILKESAEKRICHILPAL